MKMVLQVFTHRGDGQFAVLDALGTDQPVGYHADIPALALDHQDLEAVMRIEVDMQSGDDGFIRLVLQLGQRVGQLVHLVVVDDGYGTDHVGMLVSLLLLDEAVADQVADRF